MAEGLRQKPCKSLLANGEDDYEDDELSFSSFSANSLAGPLCELSLLSADLPIKRGLSKFFQGKSQSHTCLSGVRGIEDLAKKERPYNKRMKPYKRIEKSYMNRKQCYAQNHSSKIISKNAPRNSSVSMLERSRSKNRGLFYNNKASSFSMRKNYLYVFIKEEEEFES